MIYKIARLLILETPLNGGLPRHSREIVRCVADDTDADESCAYSHHLGSQLFAQVA